MWCKLLESLRCVVHNAMENTLYCKLFARFICSIDPSGLLRRIWHFVRLKLFFLYHSRSANCWKIRKFQREKTEWILCLRLVAGFFFFFLCLMCQSHNFKPCRALIKIFKFVFYLSCNCNTFARLYWQFHWNGSNKFVNKSIDFISLVNYLA